MSETKYTASHEWLEINKNEVTIGITDYAQEQLGDVVYVELPEADMEISAGDDVVVIESVKAAGEIRSPVSGTVICANEELADDPELVNREPESSGWFFKVRIHGEIDTSELLDRASYEQLVST